MYNSTPEKRIQNIYFLTCTHKYAMGKKHLKKILRSKRPMPPPRTTDNPYEAKKQYKQLLEMSKTVTFQDGIYRLLSGCARKGEPIEASKPLPFCPDDVPQENRENFLALMYATVWHGLAKAAVSIMLRKWWRAGDMGSGRPQEEAGKLYELASFWGVCSCKRQLNVLRFSSKQCSIPFERRCYCSPKSRAIKLICHVCVCHKHWDNQGFM